MLIGQVGFKGVCCASAAGKRRDGGEEGATSADKGARMTATLIMSHIHLACGGRRLSREQNKRFYARGDVVQEAAGSAQCKKAHSEFEANSGWCDFFKCFHCPTIKIRMAEQVSRESASSSVRKKIDSCS